MTEAKTAPFPLPEGLHLSLEVGEVLSDPSSYRRLVERLLYLNFTRPNISYSVQHLRQFFQQPRQPHYQATLRVLRYLRRTYNKGLFHSKVSNLQLQAYNDVDWGTC